MLQLDMLVDAKRKTSSVSVTTTHTYTNTRTHTHTFTHTQTNTLSLSLSHTHTYIHTRKQSSVSVTTCLLSLSDISQGRGSYFQTPSRGSTIGLPYCPPLNPTLKQFTPLSTVESKSPSSEC